MSRGEPLPAKGSSYRQWGEGWRPTPNGKRISLASGWLRGGLRGSGLLGARAADGRATASLLQLSQETTARLIDAANQAYFTRVPDLLLAA